MEQSAAARATAFNRTNEQGTPFHRAESASLRLEAGGPVAGSLPLLELVHLLVDVVVVLAAATAANAVHHTRHDVVVMLLRVIEAVEIADRNPDDENEDELEHVGGP